jgi:hypothetical protein
LCAMPVVVTKKQIEVIGSDCRGGRSRASPLPR